MHSITATILLPLLPLMTAFEIVKRVVGVFIYPVAYVFRRHAGQMPWWKYCLWLFMDDSIVLDSLQRCGKPLQYCCYGKREPLGFITERLPDGEFKKFMRSWNWGAWRNSAINLAIILEQWVGPMQSVIWNWGTERNCYQVRRFKSLALPYLEIHWWKIYLQCGWISCGRFQVQAKGLK